MHGFICAELQRILATTRKYVTLILHEREMTLNFSQLWIRPRNLRSHGKELGFHTLDQGSGKACAVHLGLNARCGMLPFVWVRGSPYTQGDIAYNGILQLLLLFIIIIFVTLA